jgi:prepilin peptidase CpaA
MPALSARSRFFMHCRTETRSAPIELKEGMGWMISLLIAAALAAVLIYIIFDDLKNYRVRNEAIAAILILFVVDALNAGQYQELLRHLGLAAAMLLVFLLIYAFGLMGGGDAKLLAAAFLYLNIRAWTPFVLALCAITLLYALAARLRMAPSRKVGPRTAMPFAPSIAGAWLVVMILERTP